MAAGTVVEVEVSPRDTTPVTFAVTRPASGARVTITTTGVTLQPLAFESAALSVKSGFQSAGPITSPSVILFTGGVGRPLPACPCSSVILQLSFLSPNQQITFVLADGTTFTTRSTLQFNLHATSGRLNAGDVIAIRLTAVPEPAICWLAVCGALFVRLAHGLRQKLQVKEPCTR